jgi:chromosome segregation ATPase
MNLDEKLEALTQTMELLAQMHKDNEKRMERFSREMERLSKRNVRLEGLVTEIAEGTARLLHVVETHEQRISDLEGNQPQ